MKRWPFIGTLIPSLVAAIAATPAGAQWPDGTNHRGVDPEVRAAAAASYAYGYPLVTMYMTRRVMTNVAVPEPNGRAPVNQFGSMLAYPTAGFRDVVAPNVNTLYSSAHLDLRNEPIIIHLPDTHGRYYLMQLLDAWTNVIGSPGKRITGTKKQEIALIGPNWRGELPKEVTHAYRSPTNDVWAIVRIQANGSGDYDAVNELQHKIQAVPLSVFGKDFVPPIGRVDRSIDMRTSVRAQVNALSANEFFGILASQLTINPPAPEDAWILGKLARIGVRAGHPFSVASLNGSGADAILEGVSDAKERIASHAKKMGRIRNGWHTPIVCGQFGRAYLTRASVALVGFGCNLTADALYSATTVDATDVQLTGSQRYVLHLPAGQMPPVKAFWSVTMYDSHGYLVDNSLDRSAISSWMKLKKNPDGSIDLYIQNQSPGTELESNWLPAPAGDFMLIMRQYWPHQDAILGQWVPPAVMRR